MGWYHSADWEDFAKEAAAEQAAEAAAAAARTPAPAPVRAAPPVVASGTTACPLPNDETPPPPPPDVETIFHLCQKTNWDAAYNKKEPYFPPTFLQDGKFTRATVYKKDLVKTANEYYRNTTGEFLVLELNVKVLYGLGIPILAQVAPESKPDDPVKCLQVFGGITTTLPSLLKKVYPMRRASNGYFMEVMDPPDCGCGKPKPEQPATTKSATKGKGGGKATTPSKPEQAKGGTGEKKKSSGFGKWFGGSKKSNKGAATAL